MYPFVLQIGYFGAITFAIASIGSLVATKAFQHSLKEMGLVILGCVFGAVKFGMTGVVLTTWLIYLSKLLVEFL